MYLLNRNLIRIPKPQIFLLSFLLLTFELLQTFNWKTFTDKKLGEIPQKCILNFGMLSYNFDGNCWQRVDGKSLIEIEKKNVFFFSSALNHRVLRGFCVYKPFYVKNCFSQFCFGEFLVHFSKWCDYYCILEIRWELWINLFFIHPSVCNF